jgi:hypothetical protein
MNDYAQALVGEGIGCGNGQIPNIGVLIGQAKAAVHNRQHDIRAAPSFHEHPVYPAESQRLMVALKTANALRIGDKAATRNLC